MTTSTNSQSFVPTGQELAAMSDIEFAAVWYRTEARLAADPAPEHHELMELLQPMTLLRPRPYAGARRAFPRMRLPSATDAAVPTAGAATPAVAGGAQPVFSDHAPTDHRAP
jgi:hypothetical protein